MCCSISERQVISCKCKEGTGRNFPCTTSHTQDTSSLPKVSRSKYGTTRGHRNRVGEFVFRQHFKGLQILADLVLGLPWLRSYSPTVNWKERYADVLVGR